jgi:hypothetical protein
MFDGQKAVSIIAQCHRQSVDYQEVFLCQINGESAVVAHVFQEDHGPQAVFLVKF